MTPRRLLVVGLALAAGLCVATALCQADEKKEEKKAGEMTAQQKDEALANIAAAFEMADAGRRAGSPEALVGAAKVLSRVESIVQMPDVKPVTGKADDKEKPRPGEPIKEDRDKGQVTSFSKEIKELLEDARKLNVNKDPNLTALINSVPVESRGSLRGPGSFNGGVAPGNVSTYNFNFVGGEPARVVLTSNNGVPLQLEVYNDKGAYIGGGTSRGSNEVDWTPQYTRPFTVYVTNRGARYANFNVFKN
jgi:hypothetical protein